jgi:hypothetical protein
MRDELINIIEDAYSRCGRENRFINNERDYLINAYNGIEQIWNENFHNINQINHIVISEAPLWGENQSYIYNLHSPFTQFFYENDLYYGLNKELINNRFETIIEKKQRFIKCMMDHGIIILDVSPYALNKSTALNYAKTENGSAKLNSENYLTLLNSSFIFFLEEKLNLINEKISNNSMINIIYRYTKLFNLHHEIGPHLNNSFGENNFNVHNIGIQGGGIDRDLLRNILQNQQL